MSGKGEQNSEMLSEEMERKTERCGEWDGRAKQRNLVRGKGEQHREMF